MSIQLREQEEKEIWKDIEGFPGYQISNIGNIRSFLNNRHGICANYHILKPAIDNTTGYLKVNLHGHTVAIHRLVAGAFCDGKQEGFDVNHIDGNKLNNASYNLEWCNRSNNIKHAYKLGLRVPSESNFKPVRIIETGEMFKSLKECASAINGRGHTISMCLNDKYNRQRHKELSFEYVDKDDYETYINSKTKSFLYPHQEDALKRMFNGCILNGGTGSGKSRTGLYYYFSKNGGSIENKKYTPMNSKPQDLYIITTAKKKHDLEWESELAPFLLSINPEQNQFYGNIVIVDSWNNIKKYTDVKDSFFIFDEDKVTGKGAWAKAFLQIAKKNEWIILSASPGDRWEDYETVFVANGFFKNRTEMRNEHYVYSRYAKFPKVDGYRGETRLFRLRDRILIDMDFERHTVQNHEDIYVKYDITKYKDAIRSRWDPYKNEPIQQPSGLCYVLRRIVNEDESRQIALLELLENHSKAIIFYNYDYELDILLKLGYSEGTEIAQYNGHKHEVIPKSDKWIYLVNYNACEAWNTIETNCMIFYSQNYSYKVMLQAAGRIDRLNTPYTDLYYFHLKSRSGIDLAISKALQNKKKFNERKFAKWD